MDLTPKQQTTELIRQAENILIVTGREPSNDQLASAVGLHAVLTKLGKVANIVITDRLPKVASILDTSMVARDMQGVRDFVVSIDMASTQVDKVRYDVNGSQLDITITPHGGNFTAKDVTFGYGAYQFDLVIALGVPSLAKLDRLHEANPTIFDGLHLINIDYHRINEQYGSVNLVDTSATCVAEILISTIESLGQGMIDAPIATAFLASFMSTTANFTAPATTAKALTIAAQMISAGAKQQAVVKALAMKDRPEPKTTTPASQEKVYSASKPEPKPVEDKRTEEKSEDKSAKEKPAKKDKTEKPVIDAPEEPKKEESKGDYDAGDDDESKSGSKKNSPAVKQSSPVSKSDHGQAESTAVEAASLKSALKSPLEVA